MGTCKECRWWLPNMPGGYAGECWGACSLMESGGGSPIHKQAKAFAFDTEQYSAQLFTAPDFGCVHFEAKVPEEAV
jgi:hypothetical protein